MTWPPLNPPPASMAEKTLPQWLRPPFHGASHWTFGVRPNSPPHQTMVLSSRPRSDKSCSNVAIPLSISGNLPAHRLEIILVRIPAAVVDRDIRNAAFDEPPRHEARLAELVFAVAVAQFRFFLGQIEHFRPVAEDHVVSPVFRLRGRRDLRIGGHRLRQRVELVQQFAPVFLVFFGDARSDDAFHRKRRLGRIAARRERLETRTQKPRLVKASLRFRQHDVRRNQSLVAGLVAFRSDTTAPTHGYTSRPPGCRPVCTM